VGDVWTFKDTVQTVAAIFQAAGSFSVVAAIWIYYNQRQTTLESERQANRARVTEAYMLWNRTVLLNEKNTNVSGDMLRRAHTILDKAKGILKKDEDKGRAVHILYLLMNALFLEWNYRFTYSLPMPDFYRTVDNTLGGLFRSDDEDYKLIVKDFELMFDGFDKRFTYAIMDKYGLQHGPLPTDLYRRSRWPFRNVMIRFGRKSVAVDAAESMTPQSQPSSP
jgi:hypothetical protein